MKWTDWKEKRRKSGWLPVFLWIPEEIKNRWVWLETVERQLAGWYPGPLGITELQWEYRECNDT